MMSCANCDATLNKYNESTKDCERLLDKLRDYQCELEQYKAWMRDNTRRQKEANDLYENNLKTLVARLGQLTTLPSDEHDSHDDSKRSKESKKSNIVIESIQIMSEALVQMYKNVKLKDFESKYESNLKELLEVITSKQQQQQQQPSLDLNNNNILENIPATTPPVKITMAIHQELNEYRAKSMLCKEKLNQQKQLIQSLLNKMSAKNCGGRFPVAINSAIPANTTTTTTTSSIANRNEVENHQNHYVLSETTSTTSSSSCTSNSSSFQMNHHNQRSNGESGNSQIQETYQCPKCLVQIDSSRIAIKKLESHVKKCDPSKLVCIFCLKLYEKTEQVLFENHVQKHLIKQTLEQQQQQTSVENHQHNKHNMTTTAASTPGTPVSTLNNNSI